MKKTIKQHDITDCGAACLASIAAHYKLGLPIAKIRQLASTDQKGTNLLGLIQAAEKLGFSCKGVHAEEDALRTEATFPAIAHVIIKQRLHHFVVIYRVTQNHVLVMDPGSGKMEKWNWDKFRECWTGVLLLIAPTEEFLTGHQRVSTLQRFLALVQPHRATLLQALFGAIVYTVLGLSTSIYLQKITDFVLVNGNTRLLNLLSIGMVLLLALSIFIGAMKSIMV
ncbi:MAG: cysteine peptidase family C39 domain-containing protein, partial [Bacteroidota bacterium]